MAEKEEVSRKIAIPPFAALRAFEAVFRLGGIRKAATSLSLNHAVVSRHIRQLEEWVGVPLLVRNGNRLTLTDEGSEFHASISAAITNISIATKCLLDRKEKNFLRLSCAAGLGTQWLSHKLTKFEAEHPDYSVEIKPTDSLPNLLLHESDIDLRYYADDWSPPPGGKGLKFVELIRPPVIALGSPEIARRLNQSDSVTALLKETLLQELHDKGWVCWFKHQNIPVPNELPGKRYWQAHLALDAAKSGRGIALGTPLLVRNELARGDLVQIKPSGTKRVVQGGYIFVARADTWSRPAVRAIREFLQKEARLDSEAPS